MVLSRSNIGLKSYIYSLCACVLFLISSNAFSSSIKQSCQMRPIEVESKFAFSDPVVLDGINASQFVELGRGANQLELSCQLSQQIVFSVSKNDVLNVAFSDSSKPIERLDVVSPAFLLPAGEFTVQLDIELYQDSKKEFRLLTVPDLLHQTTINYLTMGAFYGLCIVLILYVSFIGKVVSDKAFVFYGLYVFCASTFFLLQEGHLVIPFPDQYYLFNHTLHIIFAGLTVFSATFFITRITDIYLTWPRLTSQVLYPLAGIVLLMSLYLAFFDGTEVAFITGYIMAYFTLLIMIFVLSLLTIQMMEKVPLSNLVWLSLMIMVLGMAFRTFPLIESEFLTRYSLIFAFAIEALILAIVVSTRIESIQFDKLKAEIEANTDHLCEVLNRRGLLKSAKELLEKQREQGGVLSVLYIDLDGFKRINDAHGHLMGDKVLNIVSKIISNQMRSTDVLGRMGGDEFVSIGHFESTNDASFIADRVKRRFHSLVLQIDDGLEVTLAASVGHVTFTEPATSVNEMLQMADDKMFERKRGRRAFSDDSEHWL